MSFSFCHGWGCDGTIFKGLASTFKGVRCLTPDFRGFGCNPPPDRPWTIEDYARDVADYLEQLHCGKVTVIAAQFRMPCRNRACGRVSSVCKGNAVYGPRRIQTVQPETLAVGN